MSAKTPGPTDQELKLLERYFGHWDDPVLDEQADVTPEQWEELVRRKPSPAPSPAPPHE